ncbi:hypothetical protein STEG23_033977, partial [Scotinomys teguina]
LGIFGDLLFDRHSFGTSYDKDIPPTDCSELKDKEDALTEGYVGALQESRQSSSLQIRRRKASGDPYWAYSECCPLAVPSDVLVLCVTLLDLILPSSTV